MGKLTETQQKHKDVLAAITSETPAEGRSASWEEKCLTRVHEINPTLPVEKFSRKNTKGQIRSYFRVGNETYTVATGEGACIGEGAFGKAKLVLGPEGKPYVLKIMRFNGRVCQIRRRHTQLLNREIANQRKVDPDLKFFMREKPDSTTKIYLMMPYRGVCLQKYVKEKTLGMTEAESFEFRLELAIKLAVAVDDLHKKGIAHRDIKPDNVVVDESGNLHLIDFGLSCDIKSISRVHPGTPAYSLDYHQARATAGQHDVFSLLRTLYYDNRYEKDLDDNNRGDYSLFNTLKGHKELKGFLANRCDYNAPSLSAAQVASALMFYKYTKDIPRRFFDISNQGKLIDGWKKGEGELKTIAAWALIKINHGKIGNFFLNMIYRGHLTKVNALTAILNNEGVSKTQIIEVLSMHRCSMNLFNKSRETASMKEASNMFEKEPPQSLA